MLEKKKLRDIAESISGIRPSERSLEGIVSFIEEKANIVYEKQPRTFLGRLRELGYALNGVRPTQRSLRGIVNNIYENYEGGGGGSAKIYGVSGLNVKTTNNELTRTDDAVGMTYELQTVTENYSKYVSDFDNVFPYNEMKDVEINGEMFVKIPSMWFRIGVNSKSEITDIAVSQKKGEGDNWYQTKEFYYGKYFVGTKGQAPKTDIRIGAFRSEAMSKGFQLLDLYHRTIINFLFWIEFATKSSRSIFTNSTKTQIKIGDTDNFGGANETIVTSIDEFNKWRGIEELFGTTLEYVDGVYDNYNATSDSSKYGNTSLYDTLSYNTIASSNNYFGIKAFGWDSNHPFLCMPILVSSTTDERYGDRSKCGYGYYYSVGCTTVNSSQTYIGLVSYNTQYDTATGIGARHLYCPNGV